MTASKKLIQAAAGSAGGDFYPYTIDNSARFNGSSDVLYRTNDVADDATRGAISIWAKRSKLTSDQILYSTWGNGYIYFQANDTINIYDSTSGMQLITTAVYRDTSAWYHILLLLDSNNATASDRQKLYINGIRVTAFSTENTATSASNFYIFGNVTTNDINIGRYASAQNLHFGGYVAQACRTDGTHYSSETDFGQFKNGVWIPKDLSGLTFGTAGWLLDFGNSGALGTDSSGNGNNFTSSGLTSSDQMLDTPTNSFATLNPLASSARTTLSDGNLVSLGNNSTEDSVDYSTIAVTSGKWYWEETVNAISSAASYPCVGVARIIQQPSNGKYTGDSTGGGVGYFRTGAVHKEGSSVATYATFTTNDVIGVALDVDNLQISFYKNGTLQGTVTGLTSSIYYMSNTNYYNSQTTTNFGQTSFAYTPPTGYETLCTANLPEPVIGPNSTTTSDENFNTVLWTGDQSARTITGYGFQPDFLWTKCRSTAESHRLHDVVRGGNGTVLYELNSNETSAEGTDTLVSGFATDGFTIAAGGNSPNVSGRTYVGWAWKANGSGVSNTDGSITSTVSANTDAGISVVTWTGNGVTNATIGHGLGVKPAMIIAKSRSVVGDWRVWHSGLSGAGYYLTLNQTVAQGNSTSVWGTSPAQNTTTFTIGTNSDVNTSSATYLAYCFAEVEGFSSIGSYTGNGSADGPFIYCGFRPAWIMFKSSTQAFNHWYIHDTKRNTYNLADARLYPSSSGPEGTGGGYGVDINSNGYKIRNTDSGWNSSGVTYIYMAFAEMPFKYSVGR